MFTLSELLEGKVAKHNDPSKIAAIRKIEELNQDKGPGEYDVEPMPHGSSGGFVVVRHDLPAPKKYFVKKFFTSRIRSENYDDACEFFFYKLLEILGYGAKCHMTNDEVKGNLIISEDLSVTKPESHSEKTFETHRDTIFYNRKNHHNPEFEKSDRFRKDFMAIEFLLNFLEIGDVSENTANIGTVVTRSPKHEIQPKVKTKIVDLTPPATVISQKILSFDQVLESAQAFWRGSYVSKIEQEALQSRYNEALKGIFFGTHKRPSMLEAIEMAQLACRESFLVGTDFGKLDALAERLSLKTKQHSQHYLPNLQAKF
jgi:hypothetical protein